MNVSSCRLNELFKISFLLAYHLHKIVALRKRLLVVLSPDQLSQLELFHRKTQLIIHFFGAEEKIIPLIGQGVDADIPLRTVFHFFIDQFYTKLHPLARFIVHHRIVGILSVKLQHSLYDVLRDGHRHFFCFRIKVVLREDLFYKNRYGF